MITRLAHFIVALTALLLSSCIDSHEEVWINGNGSGRAEITYVVPKSAAMTQGGKEGIRAVVEKQISLAEGLRDTQIEITEEGDRIKVFVRVAFDSVLKLSELTTGPAAEQMTPAAKHFSGETDIRYKGRDVQVTRKISPGRAMPGASFMPTSTWKGHQLRYTMHLPQAALHSNATRTENQGRTLIWEIPLADAISKPIITRFETRIPIPWWSLVILTLLVILSGWFLRRWMKRRLLARS